MAHEESKREDLLREATALVERIERVPRPDGIEPAKRDLSARAIVAGFRPNGALSIFLSDDEVYHFNAPGELRRAYFDGQLYKAVKGELISLVRVRTDGQLELRSRPLSTSEQVAFIGRMVKHFAILAADLAADQFEVRQEPLNASVLDRLREWLANRTAWPIAARPNA